MALHLPAGRHVLVGFDRSAQLSPKASDRQAELAAFALFVTYAAEAVLDLLTEPRPRQSESTKLTARELDCLHWRGEGKSAWETGRILNISESRVNQVCAGAAKKLDCINAPQAMAKALRLGLIL